MHWTQAFLAMALVLYLAAFLAILVVVKRSTGTSPIGHDGGHRSVALLNKVASLLLLLTAVAYSFNAQSVDWFGRIALVDSPVVQGLGVTACVLSGVCLAWGEISLGRSFRVALPEGVQPLVSRGIYRFIRNPLALSVDLLALGVLFLAPSWLALTSLALNVVGYECKIRIEEAYLRQAHGAAYADYCARTGRYLPRVRKIWLGRGES